MRPSDISDGIGEKRNNEKSTAPYSSLRSSFRLVWRDWRSGELTILCLCLILAVCTVTSISIFTSKIQSSITEEASNFLAADAQIKGSIPIDEAYTLKARELDLRTAHTLSFRAMVFADQEMQLSAVKAVSTHYPLKGHLEIGTQAFGQGEKVQSGPAPGEIWLASRLISLLHISPGDKVSVGEANFTVGGVVLREPDSAQSFFGVAPRAIIHIDDVEKTGAVQTGSRLSYTLMLAGEADKLSEMKKFSKPQLGEHHRWVDASNNNQGIGDALSRARTFLLLAGSLSVLLAGVAIALAARRFAQRQHKRVALLKTFGQTPRDILILYSGALLLLGTVAVVFGLSIGWGLHWLILFILQDFLPASLQGASANAYWIGAASGIIALLAFAGPPLLALRQVTPAAVIRQEHGNDQSGIVKSSTSWFFGIAASLALVYIYSQNIQLTMILALGATVCFMGVSAIAYSMIRLSRSLSTKLSSQGSNAWRLGLANLTRHKSSYSLQSMIFALLLMLLYVLIMLRTNLIEQWQLQAPADAPNHFVFNIFADERENLKALFSNNNVQAQAFYPMVRGRVTHVNNLPIGEIKRADRDRVNYRRELYLTWSSTLAADNRIVEGHWWSADKGEIEDGGSRGNADSEETQYRVSVEETYASGLGITPGDSMSFSVSGIKLNAIVHSIREVQWDSMRPNFYVIFDRVIADGSAANWMTSFYLEEGNKAFLNTLTRSSPTISIIEIDQIIAQIQSVIENVSLAVEFVLLLVLIAGVLVLITSIQATMDLRLHECAILRTLGANKNFVTRVLTVEFASLGFIAGFLATIGAELCLYLMQTRFLKLDYSPNLMLWILGPIIGTLLILAFGRLATRKVSRTPPLIILRAHHQ